MVNFSKFVLEFGCENFGFFYLLECFFNSSFCVFHGYVHWYLCNVKLNK